MSNRAQLLTACKEALRKDFSLPLVGKSIETAIVDKVCELALPLLSDEVLAVITDASDGLSEDEIEAHKASIVTYINRSVDLPYLPESAEALLISRTIDALLSYLHIGKAI